MQLNGDLFGLLSAKSRWLAQRHSVLSANVANADTPSFVPLDLATPDARALMRAPPQPAIGLARTSATHLAGVGRPAAGSPEGRPAESWETTPSGNAVVIEEQAQKLAQTQLDHQLATDVYAKYLGMMRTALGVGA